MELETNKGKDGRMRRTKLANMDISFLEYIKNKYNTKFPEGSRRALDDLKSYDSKLINLKTDVLKQFDGVLNGRKKYKK